MKCSCNSVSGSHISQSSFSERFFSVFIRRYILFLLSSLLASKYHFANPTRTLWVKASGDKAVTLWDEFTGHKAVSQKGCFQFLSEDISLFTIALHGLPNITLQIPQEQSQRKSSVRESCNSVRWIHRTQSRFSESFFTVFNRRFSFFTIALYGLPNITLQIPQEQS